MIEWGIIAVPIITAAWVFVAWFIAYDDINRRHGHYDDECEVTDQ